MTSYLEAQLTARRICEETGMSMADVASLGLDEYARLSGRQTPADAARAAIAAQYEQPPAPAAPQSAPQPPAPEPQGVDIASMDWATYAQLRGQLGMGQSHKEGRGIFDSVSSRSEEYRDAVRAQTGRTALSLANVQEAPRLTGRTILRQDDMRDTRAVSGRFGTPGNFWQA